MCAKTKGMAVKCHECEAEARGVCMFCGRAVCLEHVEIAPFYSGFGQKIKDNLWPSGSDTGVIVQNALKCKACEVKYQRTY